MATFEATHESADFSEWTDTVLDGAKLTVSSEAGLAGTTYGQKYIIDNTTAKYAYKVLAAASTTGVAQLRIHFDPGGLTYSEFDTASPCRIMTNAAATIASITNTIVGGNLCMRVVMFADDTSHSDSALVIISDSPHFIEIRATKATSSSANDAKIEWWVDDEAQTTLTGVDCFDRWTNIGIILAGFSSIPAGASGTAYIDEVSFNDSGDYIGSADGGASTGILSATSASTLSSGVHSDNDWSDASNITADDGSDASITAPTFDTGDQSYLLLAHFSGLSAVPDGATIDGIEVHVNCYYANGSVSLDLIQLLDATGAPVGDNQAATPIPLGTSAAGDYVFGGSPETWGNSLTAAWVKDVDFGVAVGFVATGDNADVFVDHIAFKVFYIEEAGGPETATVTPLAVSLTIPSVTAEYIQLESATVSPLVVSLTTPSVTVTYTQIETATVSPLIASLTPPSVTATYEHIAVVTVAPLLASLTLTGITAEYIQVETATFSPLSLSLVTPAVTATYIQVETATVAPLLSTLTMPSVTAAYSSGTVATVSPLVLTITCISVSATYIQVETASVTPAVVTLTPAATTASGEVPGTASVAPIVASITVATVTAAYAEVDTAVLSPVIITLVINSATASGASPGAATVVPLPVSVTVASVTATGSAVETASVAPLLLNIAPASQTAVYAEVDQAAVIPLTLLLAVIGVTGNTGTLFDFSNTSIVFEAARSVTLEEATTSMTFEAGRGVEIE